MPSTRSPRFFSSRKICLSFCGPQFLCPCGVPKGQHPAVREGPQLVPGGCLGQGMSGPRYTKAPPLKEQIFFQTLGYFCYTMT